jgi:tetratricopeptide (TPR) repeat protein
VAATFLALLLGMVGTTTALVRARKAETETEKELANTRRESDRARKAEKTSEQELANTRRESTRARKAERELSLWLARTNAHAARLAAQRGQWQTALNHYTLALGEKGSARILRRLGQQVNQQIDPADLYNITVRLVPGKRAKSVSPRRKKDQNTSDSRIKRTVALLGKVAPLRPAEEIALRLGRLECFMALAQYRPLYAELDRLAKRKDLGKHAGAVLLWQAEAALYRPVPPGTVQRLARRALAKLFHRISREDYWWGKGNRLADLGLVLQYMTLSTRVAKVMGAAKSGQTRAWSDFQFMHLPIFRDFAEMPIFRSNNLWGVVGMALKRGALADLFGRITRRHPEGTFYYLHGIMLKMAGKWVEAEQVLQRAVAAPAFTKCRRRALYELIDVQWALARRGNSLPDPKWKARALANVRRLADLGPLPVAWAYALPVMVANNSGDYVLALSLIAHWQRQAPGIRDPLEWRLFCEQGIGAHERARATANRLLKMARPKSPRPYFTETTLLWHRYGSEWHAGD